MKLNQADILQNYRITSVQEQEKIQRRLEALGIQGEREQMGAWQ